MNKYNYFTLLVLFLFTYSCKQTKYEIKSESKFIQVKGIKTHYLDFGGDGLPIILVHSEGWDATTYKDFGPKLTNNNRVIAVTRPGYGESEISSYKVENQGDHLIAFADVLGIDKAVFIANSSASKELTYLAENYPNRLAGVVYLSGPVAPWGDVSLEDPYKAFEMYGRASPVANSEKNDRETITLARMEYRPKHYDSDSIQIDVPALVIAANNGREGNEKGVAALVFVGSPLMDELRETFPPSSLKRHLDLIAKDSVYRITELNKIQDSIARNYFFKLASDTSLQRKVLEFHLEKVYPVTLEAQDKLMKAYGQNLKLVRLDVPQIIGYEYRDTPELIILPIKSFLKDLN
ncbi:alpha/beta fold hydrolase [Flavobacterium chuncheonense]|uniref:Alpha/beta fold hydrolase n=1 Tax=Flavobacterium chuncheonense TaxID=2026653 RepID=A0ABW5YKR7_9FLAO